jgi:hypothetical protein
MGFGRVKKSRDSTTDDEYEAPATNCSSGELPRRMAHSGELHGLRRRTATNDNVEQCTGELERWNELG